MSRRRRSSPKGVMRLLLRYWGLLPLLAAVAVLTGREALAVGPVVLCGFATLTWSLVSAPSVCCALNRVTLDGQPTYCRNNSTGLLLGCNQVRAHKWQKLSSRIWWFSFLRRRGWRELWSSPAAWIATISGVLGIVSVVVTAVLALYAVVLARVP